MLSQNRRQGAATIGQQGRAKDPFMSDDKIRDARNGQGWTFLSNHGHVLLCIARERGVRLREVAQRIGITERAVQRIVADLEKDGYLSHVKEGRRNRYEVHAERKLRHPLMAHSELRVLLEILSTGHSSDLDPDVVAIGPSAAGVDQSVEAT